MNTEQFDSETGEVFEDRAADGSQRYPAVTTMTDLIFMLNDGEFNQRCSDKLGAFAADMEELGCDTGKKVKGKIVLLVDVEREHDGVYFFTPTLSVKLPPEKNGRTIGWVTAENRFTPNKPGQGNLFGTVREISNPARTVREA